MDKNKSLKIVSLNIEFNKHLDVVIPFLKNQQADVLLLQEVLEEHVDLIKKEVSMDYIFAPLAKFKIDGNILTLGLAIFSKLPIVNSEIVYYVKNGDMLPILELTEPDQMNRALIMVEVEFDAQIYRLINTHFTWTPNGDPNKQQTTDLREMMTILNTYQEFIFCGDFNAPRGKATFDELARIYKDNLPKDLTSTLDPNLHRVKGLQLVVDGIFTGPKYLVKDLVVVDGVSDHCALVAKITKLN